MKDFLSNDPVDKIMRLTEIPKYAVLELDIYIYYTYIYIYIYILYIYIYIYIYIIYIYIYIYLKNLNTFIVFFTNKHMPKQTMPVFYVNKTKFKPQATVQ